MGGNDPQVIMGKLKTSKLLHPAFIMKNEGDLLDNFNLADLNWIPSKIERELNSFFIEN